MGQLADVFKPVKRDENKPSQYVSNGVGLSICKKICEQLGGDISVSSAPNKGSEFRFTMIIPKRVDSNQLIEQGSTLIREYQMPRTFQLVNESDPYSDDENQDDGLY